MPELHAALYGIDQFLSTCKSFPAHDLIFTRIQLQLQTYNISPIFFLWLVEIDFQMGRHLEPICIQNLLVEICQKNPCNTKGTVLLKSLHTLFSNVPFTLLNFKFGYLFTFSLLISTEKLSLFISSTYFFFFMFSHYMPKINLLDCEAKLQEIFWCMSYKCYCRSRNY